MQFSALNDVCLKPTLFSSILRLRPFLELLNLTVPFLNGLFIFDSVFDSGVASFLLSLPGEPLILHHIIRNVPLNRSLHLRHLSHLLDLCLLLCALLLSLFVPEPLLLVLIDFIAFS